MHQIVAFTCPQLETIYLKVKCMFVALGTQKLLDYVLCNIIIYDPSHDQNNRFFFQ